MIPATRKELEKAFRKHLHAIRTVNEQHMNISYKLLLFYAVECGLKVLILKKIIGKTTDNILKHNELGPKLGGSRGHDLKVYLNFLNYPRYKLQNLPCKNGTQASVKDYNQVWRYGIEIENQIVENEVVRELRKIAEWIEGEI
jgi:hypothetical protein